MAANYPDNRLIRLFINQAKKAKTQTNYKLRSGSGLIKHPGTQPSEFKESANVSSMLTATINSGFHHFLSASEPKHEIPSIEYMIMKSIVRDSEVLLL